ncbi:feruloyl esterase [Corynebacterium phocae]|uniref:Feruloyl esterase n=1 Tax=Corynebacterium phocae TaxID=161895 RepID=A0A1L7D6D3_9CORY|nr:feruloyl esterase [Corynebacterium phocae]KAA8725214.1 feruloyl esterase [Corynebacterium phocae]
MHLPKDYSPQQKWPVVLAFHGWKEQAEAIEDYTQLNAAQAIMVYPQGVEGAWAPAPYATTSGAEDVEFVTNIVDSVRATYAVDDSRIHAVGMSNGGGFAVYLSCQIPETFNSVASISAAYYDKIHESCADTGVGRLDIHGTNDPVVSYYGGKRHETGYRSVDEILKRDQVRNGCQPDVEAVRLSSTSLRMRWLGCDSPLVHIRIGGGSHVWPGGTYDHSEELPPGFATDAVLDFFGIPGRPAGTSDSADALN